MMMRVDEARMRMPVRVRFADGIVRRVLMLMVFVMHVAMLVLERLVDMLMIVTLGEMQIEPDGHERGGRDKPSGERLSQHEDGHRRARKWCE